MKKLFLVALIAGIALLTAGVVMADIPAPPVNQDIGFPDVDFDALTEADCRVCHDAGVPDRHHMLYGSTIPDPTLVPNPDADGDGTPDTAYGCLNCHDESVVGDPPVITFLVERDCVVCHDAGSPHHGGADALSGDCVSCHGDIVDNFDDGHYIPTYSPSLVTPNPRAAVCEVTGDSCGDDSYCTLDVCVAKGIACVDNDSCDVAVCANSKVDCSVNGNADCVIGHCSGDGAVSCYLDAECAAVGAGSCRGEELCLDALDDVCGSENELCVESATAAPGGCNYCHDAGTDTASGLVIVNNHDTHHNTGLTSPFPTACARCHIPGDWHANDMRKCEECHGPESLHSIQADTDGDDTIEPGEELFGYGHVGADDPGGNSDCWGCHGFSVASAPGNDTITPSISSSDVLTMTAGTATVVTLTGVAFTDVQNISDVVLTAADGSTTTLTPDSITQGSLTVTIPGSIAAGNYDLQAVKDAETASNPVPLTITPQVAITAMDCSKCLGTMTITGSGFGVNADGAEEAINVIEGGRPLNVISWSDTEISVSGARCRGDVVVNGVFGSSN